MVASIRVPWYNGFMNNESHPLYNTWKHIQRRCYSESSPHYRWYGARGISLFEEWRETKRGRGAGQAFRRFAAWVEENLGQRPEGLTLDRIDVNGNYEPGNLRWATSSEQSFNRRPYTQKEKPLKYACRTKSGWSAVFKLKGVTHYAGHFDTPEKASAAARAARERLLLG